MHNPRGINMQMWLGAMALLHIRTLDGFSFLRHRRLVRAFNKSQQLSSSGAARGFMARRGVVCQRGQDQLKREGGSFDVCAWGTAVIDYAFMSACAHLADSWERLCAFHLSVELGGWQILWFYVM